MRKYLIISLLFFLNGCSNEVKEFNKKDIIFTNGLWTEKFSDEPISGKVYNTFGEEGNLKKVYSGNLLNGKYDGLWTNWYENGQKSGEFNYKDGKLDGLGTIWYENGLKMLEGTYMDGSSDGLWTKWYKNGQKKEERTYKNGKIISKKEWNEDGSIKD